MAEKGKEKGKGKIVFMLLGFILLALATGGVFFFLGGRTIGRAGVEAPKPIVKPKTLNLDSFLVNLADSSYRRYLKVTLTLEYKGEKVRQDLEEKNYRVRDAILGVLRNKKAEDLKDQEAIRHELVEIINNTLGEKKIENIYFQEMVIQ